MIKNHKKSQPENPNEVLPLQTIFEPINTEMSNAYRDMSSARLFSETPHATTLTTKANNKEGVKLSKHFLFILSFLFT